MEQTEQTKAPNIREQSRVQTKHEDHRAKGKSESHSSFNWQAVLQSELDFGQLGTQRLLDLAQRVGNQSLLTLLDRKAGTPAQAVCVLPAADPVPPFHAVQTWQPALCTEPELTGWMPGTETAWDPTLLAQSPGQQIATDWLDGNGTL